MDELKEFLKILQEGRCEEVFGTPDIMALDPDMVRVGLSKPTVGDRIVRKEDGEMFVIILEAGGQFFAVGKKDLIGFVTLSDEFDRIDHVDVGVLFA